MKGGRRAVLTLTCVAFFLGFAVMGCGKEVRPAAVAGSFYPSDADSLGKMVEGFLGQASPSVTCSGASRLVGLVSPHAGLIYSGPTAGVAFKSLWGNAFDRVYFLGVDHRVGLPIVSIWKDGAFDTPLGPVPVDATASAELLAASPLFEDQPRMHLEEHSIEVQLPFFIKALGMRPSVFVTVGGGPENGVVLGRALLKAIRAFPGRTLIVASSDWSHYHDAATAKTLDEEGVKKVLALDVDGLQKACTSGSTELCGLNGVVALMTVMKEAGAKGVLLERTDSAKGSGDSTRVVGYAAMLFESPGLGPEKAPGLGPEKAPTQGTKEDTSMDHQKEALAAVRKTLEAVLAGKEIPGISFKSPRFKDPSGVFVTLKKHGELRGCIGFVEAIRPLGDAIQEMAVSAATRDPRFPPVTLAELKEIDIEVSILTPMYPVKDLSEIQVGRDGLMLRKFPNSGLLLPQVATEYGWDRDTFLDHLCLKAGLEPGSHKSPDAKLFRFSAEVFGEKER